MLQNEDLGEAFFNCLQTSLEGFKLIDFKNAGNNTFTVVTELPYAHDDDSFRPDIIFLVNGMPLGFMEVKRQNNIDGILAERDRMYKRFRTADGFEATALVKVAFRKAEARIKGTRDGDSIRGTVELPTGLVTFEGTRG